MGIGGRLRDSGIARVRRGLWVRVRVGLAVVVVVVVRPLEMRDCPWLLLLSRCASLLLCRVRCM